MKIYNELESLGLFEWLSKTHKLKDTDISPEYLDELPLNDIHRTVVNATAFRWFREKYGIYMYPKKFDVNKWWVEWGDWNSPIYGTYEEVEESILQKMIEIVKN